MSYNARGLCLSKAIDVVSKEKPHILDAAVLKKVKISSISNGTIKGSFVVEPEMCNLASLLHGGYISSVIDVIAYYAQLSCSDGRTALTMSTHIEFIGPAKVGDILRVETTPLRTGQNAVIEAVLMNEQGALVAKSVNTFKAVDKYHQAFLDFTGFDTHLEL